MPASVALPVLLFVVVVAVAAWVYLDASAKDHAGSGVTATIFGIELSRPQDWAAGCLFLCVLCVPLYLAARRAA